MRTKLIALARRAGPAAVIVALSLALWYCPGFFTPGTYINWGDLVFPMNPPENFAEALSTWSPYNLWGQANVWLASVPWQLIVFILYVLKLPLWIINRLYMVVPTIVLGMAVYFLARAVLPGRFSRFAAVVSAVFALLVPEFPGTSLFMLSLAGYALVLLGLIRGLESGEGSSLLRWSALIALGFLMSAASPRYAVITGLSGVLYLLIRVSLESELRNRRTLKFALLTGAIVPLLNLFWILPILWFYTRGTLSDLFVTEGVFAVRIQWFEFNKPWSGVLWVSRLILGNPDNIASGVLMQFPWGPLSLLCPLYVYAVLLWRPRKRVLSFAVLSMLLTILAAAPHYPILEGIYGWLFAHVFGFNIIQSPNYWLFPMGILYAVLAGGTVQKLLDLGGASARGFRRLNWTGGILATAIILHITLVNGWTQLISVQPALGPWRRHMAPFHVPTMEIPEPYQRVNDYFMEHRKEGDRLLNLPWWESGPALYDWWPYFTAPDMTGMLKTIPSLGLVTGYNAELVKVPITAALTGRKRLGITAQILGSWISGEPEVAYQLLKLSRFRYVLLHKDYRDASTIFPLRPPTPPRDYWALRAILSENRFFRTIEENPYFVFYELREEQVLDSPARQRAVISNAPYRENQEQTSRLDSLTALFKSGWDPQQAFVSVNNQGSSRGFDPSQRLESLMSSTQGMLLVDKEIADFVLNLVVRRYGFDVGTDSIQDFSVEARPGGWYVLSQPVPRRTPQEEPAEILLAVDDQLFVPREQIARTDQLIQLSKVWRLHGELNLDPGRHRLRVFQEAKLDKWRRRIDPGKETGAEADADEDPIHFYQAELPEDFPDYSTRNRDDRTIFFLGDRRISPTYGDWSRLLSADNADQGDPAFYEVGRHGRTVIVGLRPQDASLLARSRLFFLGRNINQYISDVLVVPRNEADSLLNQLQARVAKGEPYRNIIRTEEQIDTDRYLSSGAPYVPVQGKREEGITQHRTDVFIPAPGEYTVRSLVRPRPHQHRFYLIQAKKNWGTEAARWFNALEPGAKAAAVVEKPFVLDRENIFEPEADHNHRWRWGSNNMKMVLINPNRISIQGDLRFHVASIEDRDLQVSVNRKQAGSFRLPSRYLKVPFSFQKFVAQKILRKPWAQYQNPFPVAGDLIEVKDVVLKPGANELFLYTTRKVSRLDDLLNNQDDRYASVQIWEDLDFKITKEIEEPGLPDETPVQLVGGSDAMQVRMFFTGDASEVEYALLERDLSGLHPGGSAGGDPAPGIELDDYPNFKLQFYCEDPYLQDLGVVLGINYGRGRRVDTWLPLTAKPVGNYFEIDTKLSTLALAGINESNAVENTPVADAFFRGERPRLVRLLLVPRKRLGKDLAKSGRRTPFIFEVRDLALYNEFSMLLRDDQTSLASWDRWSIAPVQRKDSSIPRYESLVTQDGAWTLSTRFENRVERVLAAPTLGAEVTFVLKAELPRVRVDLKGSDAVTETTIHSRITQVTGVLTDESEETVTLSKAKELEGAQVTLRKDGISFRIPLEKGSETEFAPDALIASIDLKDVAFSQFPSLMITYRLDDTAGQTVIPELVVDRDGDGRGDETLFPGLRETLKNWKYVETIGRFDVFETFLSPDFPDDYDTSNQEDTSWSMDRFVVTKDGVPVPKTWSAWPAGAEAVKVIGRRGFPLQRARGRRPGVAEGGRQVQVTVPAGTSPEGVYSAVYLPLPRVNIFGGKGETLELNWPQLSDEFYPNSPNARPVSLRLRLARASAFTTPPSRQDYSFEIQDVALYRKIPYSGRGENWLPVFARVIDRPLLTLDGNLFRFQPAVDMENGWNGRYLWSEPKAFKFQSSGHLPGGLRVIPDATFEVTVVEVRRGESVPPSQSQQARAAGHRSRLTRYVFDVESQGPFWLTLWQQFHPGWSAYVLKPGADARAAWYDFSALLGWLFESSRRTPVEEHFRVNVHDNGWRLDRTGRYQVVVEYTPQLVFEGGLLITCSALVVLLALLVRRRLSACGHAQAGAPLRGKG